jgi:hypothetical protein
LRARTATWPILEDVDKRRPGLRGLTATVADRFAPGAHGQVDVVQRLGASKRRCRTGARLVPWPNSLATTSSRRAREQRRDARACSWCRIDDRRVALDHDR